MKDGPEESLTEANWMNGLSDENYYRPYLVFFASEIQKYGVAQTLEKFVFARPEAAMLIRFGILLMHNHSSTDVFPIGWCRERFIR
jgi:Questin oxidase-like